VELISADYYFIKNGTLIARTLAYLSAFQEMGALRQGGLEALAECSELLYKGAQHLKAFTCFTDKPPRIRLEDLESTESLRRFLSARVDEVHAHSLESLFAEMEKATDVIKKICEGKPTSEEVERVESLVKAYWRFGWCDLACV